MHLALSAALAPGGFLPSLLAALTGASNTTPLPGLAAHLGGCLGCLAAAGLNSDSLSSGRVSRQGTKGIYKPIRELASNTWMASCQPRRSNLSSTCFSFPGTRRHPALRFLLWGPQEQLQPFHPVLLRKGDIRGSKKEGEVGSNNQGWFNALI